MKNNIVARKIRNGDEVRIIAPSRSQTVIPEQVIKVAEERLKGMGLTVSYGKFVMERDLFDSSSIENRLSDLHQAFQDKNVSLVLTVIGGYNSNQLLSKIDYSLIAANPKLFCGYSDITALSNAIYSKTGLITYSGPHLSTLGMELGCEYTIDYFKKCLFSDNSFAIFSSDKWSDDPWFKRQHERIFVQNEGWMVLNPGETEGTILGGNLCTFNLLQGTQFFPSLQNTVLFLEDDSESSPATFDRDLQSVLDLPDFKQVRGLLIGRFQNNSKMSTEKLIQIVESKDELKSLPVIANLDFGHTTPQITFPIGGEVKLKASSKNISIEVIRH